MTSKSLVIAAAAVLVTSLAAAQEVPELPAGQAVGVMGQLGPSNSITYTVRTGNYPIKAVRVYSEPSHTPLLVLIDPAFKATTEGSQWLAPLIGVTRLETPALQAAGRIQTANARQKDDNRIAVWIRGTFWTGEDDRLVADGKVGNGSFSFTSSAEFTPAPVPGDPRHCCSWPGSACSTQICVDCTGPAFTCCFCQSGQCTIGCGFTNCPDPGAC